MAKEKKKLTVKEFLMWLEGVEEMQDTAWIPNATQWKRIRDKINDIDDTPSRVVNSSQPARQVETYPADERSVPFGTPVFAPSGMVANPTADLAGKPFLPEAPNQPGRTPSIDTSNGNYNTPFI